MTVKSKIRYDTGWRNTDKCSLYENLLHTSNIPSLTPRRHGGSVRALKHLRMLHRPRFALGLADLEEGRP